MKLTRRHLVQVQSKISVEIGSVGPSYWRRDTETGTASLLSFHSMHFVQMTHIKKRSLANTFYLLVYEVICSMPRSWEWGDFILKHKYTFLCFQREHSDFIHDLSHLNNLSRDFAFFSLLHTLLPSTCSYIPLTIFNSIFFRLLRQPSTSNLPIWLITFPLYPHLCHQLSLRLEELAY
jgi:hypothetical protein